MRRPSADSELRAKLELARVLRILGYAGDRVRRPPAYPKLLAKCDLARRLLTLGYAGGRLGRLPEDPKLRAKLDLVRTRIMKNVRYAPITGLLLSRDDIFEPNLPYPTAASDGVHHYWHPEFVRTQSVEELYKVKLHELAHDWLYHTSGRAKRIMDKYGLEIGRIALDHAGNNFLTDCGESLDDTWVCDRRYQGWSAEEIAADLAKTQQANPNSNPIPKPQSGKGGGHELMENATPEQQQQAKDNTDKALAEGSIMEAIKASADLDEKEDGQCSEHMGAMLDAARANRKPFVDWRLELQDFCGSSKTSERTSTYSRVCRRPVPGLIRPGKKREGKPHIGVILDTSGSMYHQLPKVMVELEAMSADGFSFDVVCTDGEVYGPFPFGAGEFDYRDLPLKGGGGSNMTPAFETVRGHCPDADAIVFVTDGFIEWPKPELLAQLPPCMLIEMARPKLSRQGKSFTRHILIKDD